MSPSSWELRFPTLLGAVMVASILLSLNCPLAFSQLIQGSITGTVVDPSGAAVPDAEVSIMNMNTGQQRTSVTGASGQYNFPTVNAGTFNLTVTKDGFRAYTQEGVAVSINTTTRVNVTLQLGQVTEQITVAAHAATLQTDRAEVRGEVTSKELENAPIPLGRNYQMLVALLPGISQAENAHSVPSNPSRAIRFSVNGTSRSNNNTRIDGASQTNVWLPHMTAYTPSLESIDTVNVVTGSFDAEQGLAGGAAINLSVKSGTNDVHGSAFWYHNNQHLNAYPYFSDRDNDKPKFIFNQYGATIGGPVKKNKIFYFLSYEGTREHTNEQRFVDVPTEAMRQGDLSQSPNPIFDPMTGDPTDKDGAGRMPFAGNVIPQSRFSGPTRVMLNDGRWPLPNFPGRGTFGLNQNFLASGKYFFDRDTLDTKVNFNMTDKLSSFARFSYLDYDMDNPQVFGEFGGNRLHRTNSNPGRGFGFTTSGTWSTTYVASPNLVFDGYFGFTWMDTNVAQANLDQNIGTDLLGIPNTNGTRTFEGGWPRMQIDGFEQLGISNNFMPYFRSDPQWQIVANGNWTKGRHEIRFGTDLYWQNLNHEQPEFTGSVAPASGGFRHRNGATSQKGSSTVSEFNAFGSFLLGLPEAAGRIMQWPTEYHTRTSLYSLYIRDRFQASQKLTLTFGLRGEFYPQPTRKDRGLERYNFDTNEMLVCGTGDIPKDCGFGTQWGLGPRVGLAYRVTDTMVVRAGYGLTVDPYNWARPLRTNYPIMEVQNFPTIHGHSRSWATTLDDGLPPHPPEPTGSVLPMPTAAALKSMDDQIDRGYVQSWNFFIEKQLAGDWLVSAGYVGTRSTGWFTELDANYGEIGCGSNCRQLFERFGRTARTDRFGVVGTPKYDALQLKFEKRFSAGLMMQFNYTWSHARSFGPNDSGGGVAIDHPDFWGLNYGPMGVDYRHVFNTVGVFELPFGKGKNMLNEGVGAAIFGGWQINWTARMSTGRPTTPGAPGNSLNTSGSGQRADCIGPMRVIGSADMWWDITRLADPNEVDPDTPRFGTCGSNSYRGPGLINADLGVFRQFNISERVNLQFRAESFNISNTPHFNNPTASITSGNFGVVTGLQNTGREGIDQRVFRLGLRLGW